jgi:hypothetical protein
LRPTATQNQVQMLTHGSRFRDGILRYDTTIVFDVYIQICARNHAISQLQDLRKAIRSEPMIGVIANMRLEHDLLLFSGESATIDEVPDQMSNFSDVGVCWDVITIRQNKSRKSPGICFERIL